jgi:hypothetical protein
MNPRPEAPEGDELVPLAQIIKRSGLSRPRVLLALGEARERLRVYPGKGYQGREDRRKKCYPLAYTLALLRESGGGRKDKSPEIEADERVTFERVVKELDWSVPTAKKYLAAARRVVITFSDPEDSRKKLYPLRYTVRVLRREHGRVKARQSRMQDEGAGYWAALAQLKVAESRLRHLSSEAVALSKAVRTAFEGLRRRSPEVVEIHTLPDSGLALVHPLLVLVSPLRTVFWRAAIPEVPIRGEATTPEDAVIDLREKLAEKFRQLQAQPSLEPGMWGLLSDLIRVKRPRRQSGGGESHDVAGNSSQ